MNLKLWCLSCALFACVMTVNDLRAADGAVIGKVNFEQLPEELAKAQEAGLTPAEATKRKLLQRTIIWINTSSALSTPETILKQSKEITQGGGDFNPPLLAVVAGQVVNMPNNDHIIHSVFSRSKIGPFDLGTYPAGESRAVKFAKPGLAIIRCKLHADMIAKVVVVPNRHYAVISPEEPYRIDGLPAGDYKLSIWRDGFVKRNYPLKIQDGKKQVLNLNLRSIAATRKAKASATSGHYRSMDELIYPYLAADDPSFSPIWREEAIELVSGEFISVAQCHASQTNCH